jgi:hypothetical protein
MKPIVIEDKGNPVFKITIAANQVRIKMAANTSEQERAEIVQFFTAVAALPEIQNFDRSLRGKVYSTADHGAESIKTQLLILRTDSKDQMFRFNRSDFV